MGGLGKGVPYSAINTMIVRRVTKLTNGVILCFAWYEMTKECH